MTLTILKNADQVFCSMFLNWSLCDIFLIIVTWLWVGGRKTTEVKCHAHHGIGSNGTHDQQDITYGVKVDHLTEYLSAF